MAGAEEPRALVGVTPLTNVRVARGDYVMTLEKEGYAPFERSISGRGVMLGTVRMARPLMFEVPLRPAGDVPPGMVFVPGGRYRLTGWSRPTDRQVDLADFYIDRYEVSNAAFKEFISAGGYLKRQYWPEAMVHDGKPLSWDNAMRLFVDCSGLPGPRGWSNQAPPEGTRGSSGDRRLLVRGLGLRGVPRPFAADGVPVAEGGAQRHLLAHRRHDALGVNPPGEDLTTRANFGGRARCR